MDHDVLRISETLNSSKTRGPQLGLQVGKPCSNLRVVVIILRCRDYLHHLRCRRGANDSQGPRFDPAGGLEMKLLALELDSAGNIIVLASDPEINYTFGSH